MKDVEAKHVQADEIWTFCYAKAENVEDAKAAQADAGDIWTWTAMDRDSKLMISYTIGDRSGATAREFMFDLASRLATRIHYAVSLHFMHYNFVRRHKTLRMTPAMAAGLVESPWEVEDIVKLVEKRKTLHQRSVGHIEKRYFKLTHYLIFAVWLTLGCGGGPCDGLGFGT